MEPTLLAPSPGAAKPGNLYADLQTRTLWLGVEPAVDPAQAVLISDIIALQQQITASTNTAKAYTDTQITTRAPTVHTHTASQITDFSNAVQVVVNGIPGFNWVKGMIMQWSGSLAEIGVGGLAGWSLCDGSNGTPDLRDRFVIGAGSRAVGSKNTVTNLMTDSQGSHIHVVNGTAIAGWQMPSHSHGGITGYISHDHAHSFNVNSGAANADHAHNFQARTEGSGGPGAPVWQGSSGGGAATVWTSGWNANHIHNVQGGTSGVNQNHYHGIPAEGGNGAHDHTLQYAGDHAHNIPSITLREAIPFYALAFIMKL
jgi:hypothetical protein